MTATTLNQRKNKTNQPARKLLASPQAVSSRLRVVSLLGIVMLVIGTGVYLTLQSQASTTTVYPLKVAASQRTLADQNNQPYFMNVDTAWTWLSHVPDRTEALAYLDARKAQGFNTVMSFMAGFQGKTYSKGGVPAFFNGSFSQPNDAYFATIDQLVRDAGDRGMQVMMGPLNLSDNGTNDPDGLPPIAQWQALGTYLGNRYKNFDNIIWFMGGDHDVKQTWDDTTDYNPYIDAMANAIKAADGRHLMTYHPALDTYVLGTKPWLDFYAFQENRADSAPYSYMRVKGYYEFAPVKPVIDLEPAYETGDALTGVATTPYMVRRNAWWAFLQGALGVAYGGNRATWYLGATGPNQWQNYLQLDGAKATGLMSSIIAGYSWQNLIPDTTHQLVTSGYGTYGAKDYLTAGLSPDGSLAMLYVPQSRTFSVNMTKLNGPVQGYWYDPSSGAVTAIGSGLVNTGSRTFAPPTKNAAGDGDWVLALTSGQHLGPTPTPVVTAAPINTPVLSGSPTPEPVAVHGLTGQYYAGKGFGGTLLETRIDPGVDFIWRLGAPSAKVPADNFSVRWTGQIQVPTTGTYTFGINGDDGYRLYVNGAKLIDAWRDQSATYRSGKATLTGSKTYQIMVEYYDHTQSATAQLFWSGPSFSKRIIPASSFLAR